MVRLVAFLVYGRKCEDWLTTVTYFEQLPHSLQDRQAWYGSFAANKQIFCSIMLENISYPSSCNAATEPYWNTAKKTYTRRQVTCRWYKGSTLMTNNRYIASEASTNEVPLVYSWHFCAYLNCWRDHQRCFQYVAAAWIWHVAFWLVQRAGALVKTQFTDDQ